MEQFSIPLKYRCNIKFSKSKKKKNTLKIKILKYSKYNVQQIIDFEGQWYVFLSSLDWLVHSRLFHFKVNWDTRKIAMIKSTGYSSRGPGFSSEHPHGS